MPLSRRSCRSKRSRWPSWRQDAARWLTHRHAEKQPQQEPIQAGALRDHRPLDVPATPFEILERGFDAHSATIRLHAGAVGGLIRDQEPRLAVAWFPHCTNERQTGGVLASPAQGRTRTGPLLPTRSAHARHCRAGLPPSGWKVCSLETRSK